MRLSHSSSFSKISSAAPTIPLRTISSPSSFWRAAHEGNHTDSPYRSRAAAAAACADSGTSVPRSSSTWERGGEHETGTWGGAHPSFNGRPGIETLLYVMLSAMLRAS